MRQNGMKLGGDQKAEFKKSYKFYRQISLMVLTKVAVNLSIFHGMDKCEQNEANI
jgi:hypothetical protein